LYVDLDLAEHDLTLIQILVYLLISPLAFALGSDKRKYTSLTATKGAYNPAANLTLPTWVSKQRPCSWPPQSWLDRAVNEDWKYLLEDTPPGQLICVRRGKVLTVACGHVGCFISLHTDPFILKLSQMPKISFGLEAHLRTMTPEIFWKIIECDRPGPNKDDEKAEKMRIFVIPPEFTVKGSSHTDIHRTIRILAAFISEEYVIVLCDFCGLARMHVESRGVPWTKLDFQVGTQVRNKYSQSCQKILTHWNLLFKPWNTLFRKFKGGPDWIIERELAEGALKTWRANVREEHDQYQYVNSSLVELNV
jgi:hypothetical protein